MTETPRRTILSGLLGLAPFAGVEPVRGQDKSPFDKWEKSIAAFEEKEKEKPVPANGVIFLGSSSIVKWNLEKSFPGLGYVNRGFGGSQLADSVHFAPRLLSKQQPRTVVLYAGDNDLAAGKTPEKVFADFQEFVKVVRKDLPKTKIVFVAIKPSPKRVALLDKAKKTNGLIADFCKSDGQIVFVDVFEPMLSDGKPRPELFGPDMLHMNEKGYELWAPLVRPHLK